MKKRLIIAILSEAGALFAVTVAPDSRPTSAAPTSITKEWLRAKRKTGLPRWSTSPHGLAHTVLTVARSTV